MTLEEAQQREGKDSQEQQNIDSTEDEERLVEPDETLDDDQCTELREKRDEGYSYMQLFEATSLSAWDVVAHIRGECDCTPSLSPIDDDKPWAEKEIVEELFIEQNYHFTQIAELFGCHHETVKNWARDHHEITIVDDSIRTSSKTVRQLQRLGIQKEDDIDLPPEARKSPFDT